MKKQNKNEKTISNIKVKLTDEEVSLKEKYTKEVLLKKKEYKELGKNLIKRDLISKWNSEVNKLYRTKDSIWYNSVVLEATLICMRCLSNGTSIEEVYKIIDIQNLEMPPVILGMKLTGYQNYLVTELVATYHKRGEEFYCYRNAFIKKPHYRNQDVISLKLNKNYSL